MVTLIRTFEGSAHVYTFAPPIRKASPGGPYEISHDVMFHRLPTEATGRTIADSPDLVRARLINRETGEATVLEVHGGHLRLAEVIRQQDLNTWFIIETYFEPRASNGRTLADMVHEMITSA